MIYSPNDKDLTIELTPEFVSELRQIIQKERELNRNAQNFYETMTKQLQENDKKLEELAAQLDRGEFLAATRTNS